MAPLNLSEEWLEVQKVAQNQPTRLERYLRKCGIHRCAGVDEAGRGPLAGPVVACACILPTDALFPGLADSKTLSTNVRQRFFHELTTCAGLEYAVAVVDHTVIDQINILQATLQAMYQAITSLRVVPEVVIVDGPHLPHGLHVPSLAVIRADQQCACVSAASVIAKCVRDQIMVELDTQWPQYGFALHKGYGTELHRERLALHGPCPIHRRTFAPVRDVMDDRLSK